MRDYGRSVSYRQALQQATSFVRNGNDFLVVSHLSPDGDAISSTSAVGFILHALGKSYTLINEGKTPEKFIGLLEKQSILNYRLDPPERSFDYIITVDCADFDRVGDVRGLFSEQAKLLNIDHHPTNDHFGTYNVVNAQAAATVEIIYDLAEELQVPWTKPLAACIYAGLLTDTGGFRYSNTSPNVMRIAERMLSLGVDGSALADQLLETMTYAQVLLLKEALSTLTFTEDRKIAWLTVTKDSLDRTGALDEDTEGLVNIPRNISGVEVGMMFKEKEGNSVKVSLRSTGKVDVSQLAKSLGGGGHVSAAGCTINGTLDEVVGRLVEAVSKSL